MERENLIEGIENLIEFRDGIEDSEDTYEDKKEALENGGVDLKKRFKKQYIDYKETEKESTNKTPANIIYNKYNEFSKKEKFDNMVDKWIESLEIGYEREKNTVNNRNINNVDPMQKSYDNYKKAKENADRVKNNKPYDLKLLVIGIILLSIACISSIIVALAFTTTGENGESELTDVGGILEFISLAVGAAGTPIFIVSLVVPRKKRSGVILEERRLYDEVVDKYNLAYNDTLKKISIIENNINVFQNKKVEDDFAKEKEEITAKYVESNNLLPENIQNLILELGYEGYEYFKKNYLRIETQKDIYELCDKCYNVQRLANIEESQDEINARQQMILMTQTMQLKVQTLGLQKLNQIHSEVQDLNANIEKQNELLEEQNSSDGYCITCKIRNSCTHVGHPIGFCKE